MRVLILSSGGKDSTLALWWALCQGWTISSIITVNVEGDDSWMFQIPATQVTKLQAEAMSIDHHRLLVTGENDIEVEQLGKGLAPLIEFYEIDALVCGALRSEYQRRRLDKMCEELGIHSFSPLWHHNPEQHMRELLECGMEMWIVSVSCDGLNEEWLGRKLDQSSFEELCSLCDEFRFSIDGEGGEFETIITSGPHMNGRITFDYETHWFGNRGHIEITDMQLL